MALQYELFYLVGEKNETDLARIQEEVVKLVEAQGGTWLPEESIERRKLAYPIKKETRGIYVTKRFTVPNIDERKKTDKEGSIAELSRQLELHKSVLRHLVVRAEGLPALGERETVPTLPRPGRRDDRRGGRSDAQQAREEAVDARLARKPEATAPVQEAVKEEVKEAPVVAEKAPKAEKVEKEAPKKKVAAKTEEKTEKKEEAEAPKKRATRKKKEVSIDEAEIDKKLDEVLNL